MRLPAASNRRAALLSAAVAGSIVVNPVSAAPFFRRSNASDPFAVVDPQNWVNPDDMTWADFVAPPNTNWSDPAVKGSSRNFNIALITLDYSDKPFTISLPVNSTIFGNPQPAAYGIPREDVPAFYRDLLNKPGGLNRGHTLHEYWMEDSAGRFGVDLTVFGPYEMPRKSYQYGIDSGFNPGACPEGEECDIEIRDDALATWRADVGNATADSYELVFILSAGQDESATWQEFGEMKFLNKEDVPDPFGPPGNSSLPNYAKTRYVEWTSWASASCIWPNAGGGSSTQAESSGMSTYAHELSHLLNIGDNYNNPYGVPLRRAYTGPWSMMSRGTFNGPGGPHTRWQIPALQGSSLGSLHTMRDKVQLGLIGNESVLTLSRDELSTTGLIVANLTARSVNPNTATGLMGVRINIDKDLSPYCNVSTEVLCDGGGYNSFDVEVVDRMGADSFTPDSGVMISKSKIDSDSAPFQWVIDANPQDIELIDFYRPNGSVAYITRGDYRQLADALFHAGTRSGSEFEYVDEANGLHFYIVNRARNANGVLTYTVAARSLTGASNTTAHGVSLSEGSVVSPGYGASSAGGSLCSFTLTNTGSTKNGTAAYVGSDLYRLSAEVEGEGWEVVVPNALLLAEFGATATAEVAVGSSGNATAKAVVTLTATSESDGTVSATGECVVSKA